MAKKKARKEIVLQGIAASPGVAHGRAFVFLQKELEIPIYKVEEPDQAGEIQRFEDALMRTRTQIADVRHEVAEKLGEAEAQIFDAHLLVLEDRALIEETIQEHHNTSYNIEYCFHSVSKRYLEAFKHIDDEYIKERVTDIRDVTKRLLNNLLGHCSSTIGRLTQQKILVSEDLSPSDTAALDRKQVLGILMDAGSRTSHAVIMARSLQVPAVVGLHDISRKVENEDTLLIDGYDGVVIINPTEETLYRYGQLKLQRESIQKVFESVIGLPAQTQDGKHVELLANIEGVDDLESVKQSGAEGVGLLRTEALFLRKDHFPTEEEQFELYKEIVQALYPMPVTIRTLDLGGDKKISGVFFSEDEDNPFMGFRAIRFCLDHVDIFKAQLRAILRSSAFGKVKLMYPMITSYAELSQANKILKECKAELKKKKIAFDPDIAIGSMIETPSAACTADLLAEECSFFSIGTNDLIQYMLAVDRINDRIAHMYEPNHPAVIRTLKNIVDTAHLKGIKVSVCGEMAGDPLYVPLLLGLGVDDLSTIPACLPEIKYLIRNMTIKEVQTLASKALKQTQPKAVFNLLQKFYLEHVGNVLQAQDGQE